MNAAPSSEKPNFELTPLPESSQEPSTTGNVSEQEPGVYAQTSTPGGKAEPVKLTRQQIGKMRRQYFTTVHGKVTACGHKFHPTNQPRINCDACWEAFFRVHTGVVTGIQSIIATFGEEKLIEARGTKFVKRYKQYAAMVEEEQRNATTDAAIQ